MDFFIVFFAKYLIFLIIAGFFLFLALQKRENQKKIIIYSLITLPLAFILSRIASKIYFDPRPFVTLNVPPLIPHAPDNGFPSDHALLGFSLSFLVYAFDKKLGFSLILLTVLVGLGRIFARVHWPIDIMGSFLIAGLSVFIVGIVLKKLRL